jgi:phosphoribosylglycinamide formyltransferase-1
LVAETRKKTAILISGRGSNMAALIGAAADPAYPAEIALVISDRGDAAGLDYARRHRVATALVERSALPSKAEFETALTTSLNSAGIELVCLAGFMRLLSPAFVEAWRDRLLNIHPSLLPAFPGLDTHARALAAGVRLHGATVHFVRAEVDNGPIVAQGAIAVLPGDTPATLAARVLTVEHRLYPLALKLVASGAARVSEETVVVAADVWFDETALLSPAD